MNKEIKKSAKFYFRILQDAKMFCKPKKKEETVSKKSVWKNSDRSEHFGKRNQIVKVKTKNGITSMKLKNALKKGLQYFNTPA